MQIKSSGRKIISSGTVLSYDMSDIEFEISTEPKMVLIFKIKLTDDDESSISGNVIDSETMQIIIKNPYGKEDFGPVKPISVGTLDGKSISVAFRVNAIEGHASFELGYTFFYEA